MPGKVEKIVVDWLNIHNPGWRGGMWTEAEFEAYESLPVEIKMVPAFKFLEHNMINGGWAQFFWNGFDYWRLLIEIASEGYQVIGAKPEVFGALDKLFELCEANEAGCEKELDSDDWDFSKFIASMHKKYGIEGTRFEMLLWSGTDMYWKRLSWLDQNEDLVQRLLSESIPNKQVGPISEA